jgi:hypothetical protein
MKKPESEKEIGWREKLLNSPAEQEYLAERDRGEPLQKWQREAIAAKTVLEHRQALTDSIIALRLMAQYRGDKEAVMALVECGVQAAHQLHTLHQGHDADDKPPEDALAVMLVNEVAASAEHWPVAVSAFQEKPGSTVPPGIGCNLPFRAASLGGSGSPRDLSEGSTTDFALWAFQRIESFRNRHDTFQPLSSSWITSGIVFTGPPRTFGEDVWGEDADQLEPFSKASLAAWVVVAMKMLKHDCDGHWTGYPFPPGIETEALLKVRDSVVRRRTSKRKIGSEVSENTLISCTRLAVKSVLEKRGKSLLVR